MRTQRGRASSTDNYAGLPWALEPARSASIATSPTTSLRYAARWEAGGGRVEALVFAPLGAGAPAPSQRIGWFSRLELALLACERHDYGFVLSVRPQALFQGSDTVRDWAEALRGDGAEDTLLLDLLVEEERRLPSGLPFRRAASYFEGRKGAFKQEKDGSFSLTLSIPSDGLPLWLAETKPGSGLLLGAVRAEAADLPDAEAWAERGAAAFTRAFALPPDPAFQEWLSARYDRWGLLRDAATQESDAVEKAASETLKRMVGVASRRSLHANRDAIERLERLDQEFHSDLCAGFGVRPASKTNPGPAPRGGGH